MTSQQSKKLSYILRHHPEKFNITLDKKGYAKVDDIVAKTELTKDDVETIVKNDDKTRYSFNDDHSLIKAIQGHSIEIQHDFKQVNPTRYLFHGTAQHNFLSITKTGLNKMNRHHVHLSEDIDTAINVGERHGKVIVFKVDVFSMIKDKFKFYKSKNNVWLTDHVPPKYLSQVPKEAIMNIPCNGVIVFNKDLSKVTLVKANHWGFPKGKKEKGETSLQNALRELEEETGLTENMIGGISDQSKVQIEYSNKGKPAVKFFLATLIGSEVPLKMRDGDELSEVKWVTISEARKLLEIKNRKDILENSLKLVR